MSRKKTEINPIRAERVKKLIEREGISQIDFANRIFQTQQNVSRIINLKTALTEKTAQDIVSAFPEYRIEWLLGYDDFMTTDDLLDHIYSKPEKFASTVSMLARLRKIEFALFDSGIYMNDDNRYEDRFIVRKDGHEGYMTYSEVSDLIDDLSALTESRLSRILK